MAQANRGKQFENVIRKAFVDVPDTSVDRVPDQMSGFYGSSNICDFVVYHYPTQYYIECKVTHGNTFPLSRITDKQLYGLCDKSKIFGVVAGVIVWWIDKDVTKFIPIETIMRMKESGKKSVSYAYDHFSIIDIEGVKARTFYRYNMKPFLEGWKNV